MKRDPVVIAAERAARELRRRERIAKKEAAEIRAAAMLEHNGRLAAAKTKQERKQKRAYQKWAAEVRTNGRPVQRMREPPYAKIKRSGSLNVYEETAADELLAAYHFSMGIAAQRDSEPDMPTGPRRPDTADYIAAHASDLVKAYQTWRADLCDTIPLRIVKAVLFAETPLSELDAKGHWRAGTTKIHFVAGIRHFAMLRGSVPRGAHAWTFDPTKSVTDLKKEQAA